MKILYPVIDGEISGGNIICLRIIEEALKRGYQVVVNSPSKGKLTNILKGKGIRVYNIDTRCSWRLDNAIKLARIIKKENICLIHSHTPLSATVLSRLAGWLARAPVITHAHTWDFMSPNPMVKCYQFLLNWLTSRFFCAQIIAVSRGVKDEIIKQGVTANKIKVIYNGIGLADNECAKNPSEIRKELGLRQDQRVIGEVSRLCKDKGQDILIKAAQKVIKNNPDTVFMIVGEDFERRGAYKKNLEELVSDLGLKEQIIFTGYRSDIMGLMNAFELFVLPSLVEGLPVVILEAMAAKRPVITTPVGGNPEIVIDGETGTIVPPEDPGKLAEAIIYHLNNPEISKRMGEKGYERVRKYFSLSQMLDKIMNIYKEILIEK